mgnify:CR=1 FL=1
MRSRDVPTYEAPADLPRRIKVLLDKSTVGSKNLCMGIYILMPGQRSPVDVHPDMEEAHYVVRGRGSLVLGRERYEIHGGDAAYIGPGVSHQCFNTGTGELRFIWVFTPHPAEYRFLKDKWKRVETSRKRVKVGRVLSKRRERRRKQPYPKRYYASSYASPRQA